MTTRSIAYSPVPVGQSPKPIFPATPSWRNTLALGVSSVLGAILTVILSPFLLAAAISLWWSRMK